MTLIHKEELLKIAQISQLKLYDNEISALTQQIQDVLSYAASVSKVAPHALTHEHAIAINIFRNDTSAPCMANEILKQAPEHEHHYFVVPKVIESK